MALWEVEGAIFVGQKGNGTPCRAVGSPCRRGALGTVVVTTEVAIRYSMRSNELDVSATREGLLEIADLVEAGDGRVVADDGVDPLPYDVCIPLLVVRRLAGGGVVIRVSKEMSDVTLEGGQDALRLLAENLRGLAVEGADDEHLHLEYFAGHFYLEEASVPAVVGLVGN